MAYQYVVKLNYMFLFVLNVQQTAKLVAYLTSTADYMEYLGAKQST